MVVLRWAAAGGELAARAPRLYQQVPPGEPAVYHGGTVVAGRVVLRWATSLGLVCVAYPIPGYAWQPPTSLLESLPEAATVVAVRGDYDLGGPGLRAADWVVPGAQPTSYPVT